MVSVRISRDILSEIKQEAVAKFLLSDPKPTNKIAMSNQILDAVSKIPYYKAVQDFFAHPDVIAMGQSKAAANSSLGKYLNSFKDTDIARKIVVGGLKDIHGKPFEFNCELRVPCTMHFVEPYYKALAIHIDMIPEPTKQELIDAVATSLADVQAWEERFKTYTAKTNEIFDACRTTAQLLSAWPAAEAFLPKAVVAKMQTKVVSQADLDAKAKREACTSEGLDEHILIANIVSQTSGGGTQGQGSI